MILIAGTLSIDADQADTFWSGAVVMMKASRAETGCAAYTFSKDATDPSVVHLFEVWDSEESLDQHGASDHMKAFGATLGGVVTGRHLSTYHNATVEPRP